MPSYPYLAYESDEAIEADELYGELDEADESDEAVRRRPQRRMGAPIRTPQRGGNIPPRPQAGFATRAELTATANRLDAKIGQLSTGVKALDGRVRALDSEQGKLRSALAAETKKREALAGQINNVQQMSMLMPLLSTQQTRNVTTPVPGTGLTTNDKVVVDNGDSLSRILPMLLFSGAGNTGQSGSGGMFGGDNNTMMMLAMVMAMKP
jgi:outer membrane murein-binding lipoprotein Lpp